MFARTKRLTLRPGWPEDAAALAKAIGHESVAGMVSRVPFPYRLADAEAFLALPRDAHEPRFQIILHDGHAPTLIGGIAITLEEAGPELGYWLAPHAWGRGYATEAGHAVVQMARDCLPVDRLGAWHFADNPRSGAVLRKLGFRPTGRTVARQSSARRAPAASLEYALDLEEGRTGVPMPIAA